MKKILLITFLFGTTNLFAQQVDSTLVNEIPNLKNNIFQQSQKIDALTKEINFQKELLQQQEEQFESVYATLGKQQNAIKQQKELVGTLQNRIQAQRATIDSLNKLIQTNEKNIVTNSRELGTKIQETGEKADSQIAQLDSNVEKNRLYWIIATFLILLLGGLIYWLLGKRIASSKTDVETQIRNTKKSLEEESVKLDRKLVEVLETQLKLKEEETKVLPNASNNKADHSLALKVADEIIRIQKNLSRMDENTKGLKQLNSSVKRIQDNFASNSYELVDMLGKEFNEGMKATVNFVQDEDFEEGKRIITRIIKPQVNYKGTMIQTAQIEVTEA